MSEPSRLQIEAAAKAYTELREGKGRWEALSPGSKQHAMDIAILMLSAADEAPVACCFCGNPAGDDSVMDDNGEVACRPCASAEFATQRKENSAAS